MDTSLSWKDHFENLCVRLSRVIFVVGGLKKAAYSQIFKNNLLCFFIIINRIWVDSMGG